MTILHKTNLSTKQHCGTISINQPTEPPSAPNNFCSSHSTWCYGDQVVTAAAEAEAAWQHQEKQRVWQEE